MALGLPPPPQGPGVVGARWALGGLFSSLGGGSCALTSFFPIKNLAVLPPLPPAPPLLLVQVVPGVGEGSGRELRAGGEEGDTAGDVP